MQSRVRVLAQLAAKCVLESFRTEHPTYSDERTPVEAIAAWLGLQVETFHPADYPRGTYGFVDADEDEHLVWLCRDLSETLRRFTLAHELGHAVLHCPGGERIQAILRQLHNEVSDATTVPELSRRDPCQSDDVQEEMTALFEQEQIEEMLGHGASGKYDPRSQREIAANLFAAELLMPSTRVTALYLAQQVRAYTLADLFGVSQAAMLNRLTELPKFSVTRADISPDSSSDSNTPTSSSCSDTPAGAVNTPASPPRKQYDQFQQAAIEAATPALITAGPGSGKTSTLIGRVAYLVSTLGVAPHAILALTFSRKAAQEMEERLAQIVHGDSLPRVSTFHAFCADLLRQYGTLVGLRPDFLLLDEVEGYFLLRQLANNFYLRHYQTLQAPAYYFPDILKAISRAKDELTSPAQYAYLAQQMQAQASSEEAIQQAERALEVAYVYKLYEEALHQRGDTDFGGLLVLAVQLLREHPAVLQEQQQRYQHILVDEFQDMNRASGVLLRELAGAERRVWVVGDANQAIYGFRGASPANISQFEQDYPGAVVLPLSRNYRSHPDLVALAESFRCTQLELGQVPGKNQPVRLPQPDVCVTVAQATNEVGELEGILQDIHYKHAHGYAYRDMVVLCRTRAQVQKVSSALAAGGLPVAERSSMLEQEYIKNALAIVLLLSDSSAMGLLRAARQPEHSLSQRDIEAVLLAARERATTPVGLLLHGELPLDLSTQGRASLTRLIEILQTLHWASDMWSLLAHYLLLDTSRIRDLLRCPEDKEAQAALADYDALLQLARRYDQQQRLKQREQETNAQEGHKEHKTPLHEQARDFLEYLSLLVMLRQDGGNRQQDTAESSSEQADVIRVMTVHASKGLEFPVVYLPFLVQRRFPLQQRSNPVPAPLGMLPAESEGARSHEISESCLFYVGVTRARDALILSYSERYGKLSYKCSPYLGVLEAGLADQRINKLHWDVGARFIAHTVPEPDTAVSTQPSENFIQTMRACKAVNVSDVEAYQRCPRQYAYRHIYHFQSEEGAYQLFWRATQNTIADVSRRLQACKESQAAPTQQAVRDLYDQHWQELLGASTLPFAALYQQHGHEIVESIRRHLCTREDVKWELRQDHMVDIAGQTVQVPIDRVEASTPVKFIRTRYGKRKGKPVAETREMLYTRAYRQAHPGQSVELYSHNLSTGETVPITMTAKKEQSLYDEVARALLAMQRNAYPAQPAEPFRCPACPFFFICPA